MLDCVSGCFYAEILIRPRAFAWRMEEHCSGSRQRITRGGFGITRQRIGRAVPREHKLDPKGKLIARNRSIPQSNERERRERSCYVPHPTRRAPAQWSLPGAVPVTFARGAFALKRPSACPMAPLTGRTQGLSPNMKPAKKVGKNSDLGLLVPHRFARSPV